MEVSDLHREPVGYLCFAIVELWDPLGEARRIWQACPPNRLADFASRVFSLPPLSDSCAGLSRPHVRTRGRPGRGESRRTRPSSQAGAPYWSRPTGRRTRP